MTSDVRKLFSTTHWKLLVKDKDLQTMNDGANN